jgi:predicted RNA-binding protein with RPS1 domain
MNADELILFTARQSKRIAELGTLKRTLERERRNAEDFQMTIYFSDLERKVEQWLTDEQEELKRTLEEEKQ